MKPVSVVIITRNEAHNIISCVASARLITDDIVVVDAESGDATVTLAKAAGARTFIKPWQGYGVARNLGASKAKHNWILALDADERISSQLVTSIQKLPFADPHIVYKFSRTNFIGNRKIRFGTLGFDWVARLYNRGSFQWDLTLVHECLQGDGLKRKKISGSIYHYGLKDLNDYQRKAECYAQLCAQKYWMAGRKFTWVKYFFSPLFNSVKSYLFQGGFFEGKQGLSLARTIDHYSRLKYQYLQQLYEQQSKDASLFSSHRSAADVATPAFSSER